VPDPTVSADRAPPTLDLRTVGTIVAIVGTLLALLGSAGTWAYASGVQDTRIDSIEQACEDHQVELERRLDRLEDEVEPVGPSLARIEATLESIDRRLERLEETP